MSEAADAVSTVQQEAAQRSTPGAPRPTEPGARNVPAEAVANTADTDSVVEAAGHFRIYLGAAAGVGKTYDMLNEGKRRLERGTDVVVGFVECHKRPLTEKLLEGFEVVPRGAASRRWTSTRSWPVTPRSLLLTS